MLTSIRRDLLASIVALAVLTLALGLAYPLVVTGVSQVAFNHPANGSLVSHGGHVVGSRLLGQGFTSPRYFHSRPSFTRYSANATAFSNAGPNGADTRRAIADNARTYLATERRYEPTLTRAQIPPDAVQTSASGVDPHISPANARIQAHRIAAVRGLPLTRVGALVARNTDSRGLGVFGEPGVNVLQLNLALDQEPAR